MDADDRDKLVEVSSEDIAFAARMALGLRYGKMAKPPRGESWEAWGRQVAEHFRMSGYRVFRPAPNSDKPRDTSLMGPLRS